MGVALLAVLGAAAWWGLLPHETAVTNSAAVIEVYKNPQCGCCGQWVSHVRAHGFVVQVHDASNTEATRAMLGVPSALGSCHTAKINGYVIEGHVPAADIGRLLKERPAIVGLAVPGMPAGSPGMESPSPLAYQTLAFSATGDTQVFADHSIPTP